MQLIYESSLSEAKTFVLSWAEGVMGDEEKRGLVEEAMNKQWGLLFGVRGGLNQSIVISKGARRKDLFCKIKNVLKKVNMDRFLMEVETFDCFRAENWGWVPQFCKPATISAGSSSDPAPQVTPAQEVVWLGKTPKTISVYPTIGLPKQPSGCSTVPRCVAWNSRKTP